MCTAENKATRLQVLWLPACKFVSFPPCQGSITHWSMQPWYLKHHHAHLVECLLHSYKSSHKDVSFLGRSHRTRFPDRYSFIGFSKVMCKSWCKPCSLLSSQPYCSNSIPVLESNLFKLTNSLSQFQAWAGVPGLFYVFLVCIFF